MTPKEKAAELYFKFLKAGKGVPNSDLAKESAIICVEEIINHPSIRACFPKRGVVHDEIHVTFWEDVKTEITNL